MRGGDGAEPGQTFWARSRGWSVAPTHPPPRLGPWQPRASVWPPVCPPASRRDVERRVSSCRRRPWWRRRSKTGWMLRRGDSTGSARIRQSPTASAPGLLPGQTRPATCPLSSGRLLNELSERLAEPGCLGMMDGVVRRGLGGFWALLPPPTHGCIAAAAGDKLARICRCVRAASLICAVGRAHVWGVGGTGPRRSWACWWQREWRRAPGGRHQLLGPCVRGQACISAPSLSTALAACTPVCTLRSSRHGPSEGAPHDAERLAEGPRAPRLA